MDGFSDFFSGIGDFFSGGSSSSQQNPDLSNVVAPPPTLPDTSTFGGTPTGSGGLDFTNSYGFNPLSFSAPSSSSSGAITQPNNLGGVAAPTFATGDVNSFLNPSSALSQGAPNIGQGPTNTNAPPATPQDNSLLSLFGFGTGNQKTDQTLLGAGVSGAGLAYNLLAGSPSASAEKQLKNIAGQQSSQGQQLESYIANGTLPPGAQQWVNQQTAGQQAAIRAKYAQLGMTGSTAETQELNNVQAQATSQMFTIASQLLNTGVNETNASGTLYNYLMNAQNADAKDVSAAIQNFVSALGGGGSPRSISLNLPGAQ